MNLPSRQECGRLFKKFHTPPGIINHNLTVNKIANYLALQLKRQGIEINLDLVDRASLLHDLLRVCDLKPEILSKFPEYKDHRQFWQTQQEKYKNYHHAQAAAEALKNQYPELAQVILEHMFKYLGNLSSWEAKIVHYADKRVDFDQVVSLETRYQKGLRRWGIDPEELRQTFDKLRLLEKEIFSLIGQNPEILAKLA